MGPRWELLMALAMLRSFEGPLLGVSHGHSCALELGCFFFWRFSRPFLCLGAWMFLLWELLMVLAMLGSLDGPSLGVSHSPCYVLKL